MQVSYERLQLTQQICSAHMPWRWQLHVESKMGVCLQVVNTIEAAHPDKPRPALPPKVTEMAKLRNDIMVVPRQTGDALVHPGLDQLKQKTWCLQLPSLFTVLLVARPDRFEQCCSSRAQEVVRPLALDERMAVLAAAISIDFDYFSQHSQHGAGSMLPFFLPIPMPSPPYPPEDAAGAGGAEGAAAGDNAGARCEAR